MPEIQFTSLASASRNRTVTIANRNEADRRVADDKRIAENYDAVQRRKEISDEIVVRQERAIQLRRNDLEEGYEVARVRSEQSRFSDTVANDTAFEIRQDEIAGELNDQRANRAAIYDVTLSEFDEGLALDQLPDGSGAAAAEQSADGTSSFSSFLADRNSRISERALAERDRSVQQQIDLRVADDNLRSSPQGSDLPRGALVDVLG